MQKAKLSDNSRSLRLLRVRKEKSLGFKRKYYTKGISPLLATVLLIATTVVISTMLAGWMSSTTSATQNTVTNKTNEGVACVAAEIVIDDVYSGAGSGGIARAIVRNSGGTDNLQIISAEMYDKYGNNLTTTNSLPINLNKGQMTTLRFDWMPTAFDSSAYGNNGTLAGATYIYSGHNNTAVNFDGINDYISVSDSSSLDITGGITLEAWVRINESSSTVREIVSKNDAYLFAVRSDGYNYCYLRNVANWTYSSGPSVIFNNSWHHVACTYNGTVIAFYVDGSVGSSTQVPNVAINTNNNALEISNSGAEPFNGTIDDVMIWNRTLTSAEITTTMNGGIPSNTNDRVGWWKLDEGKGILSCPSDFSRVVVTTSCGGVSAEFTKSPKC